MGIIAQIAALAQQIVDRAIGPVTADHHKRFLNKRLDKRRLRQLKMRLYKQRRVNFIAAKPRVQVL